MKLVCRRNAILREESVILHNGGYEEYVDTMNVIDIHTEIKLMSCDAFNLLMHHIFGYYALIKLLSFDNYAPKRYTLSTVYPQSQE